MNTKDFNQLFQLSLQKEEQKDMLQYFLIMIYFLIFAILFFFVFIIFFSFPQLSPIPYFPTSKKDLLLIMKALVLKNNQVIFDLGAGDGRVVFEAAKKAYKKKLNTQFIAVEINPILILILSFRRLFHPNKKNIVIIKNDILKMNLSSLITNNQYLITFYLYISPWYLEKVLFNIKRQLSYFTVVSYMYPIKFLKKPNKIYQGKNLIYLYKIKALN